MLLRQRPGSFRWMKRIVLASANPVKVRATLAGFQQVFPVERFVVESVALPSGVRAQPRTDAETLEGARNRARGAERLLPDADFWVGIEGGVAEGKGELLSFSWICVRSSDCTGISRTATFLLPPEAATLVRQGGELGAVSDRLFQRHDSSRTAGAVGLLTGGLIDRTQLYAPAMVLALIPFRNRGLFPGSRRSASPEGA